MADIKRNNEKLLSLDIYKALGALLVIMIHITSEPIANGVQGAIGAMILGINKFSLPAVPMFIFASGFALTYSFSNKPLPWGKFMTRRFTKIVIPYLVWCIIYYSMFLSTKVLVWNPLDFIKMIITGNLVFHLYFVVIIMQFYIIFNLIYRGVKRIPGYIALPACFIIASLFKIFIVNHWTDRIFITYLPFFIAGCYFAKDMDKAKRLIRKYALLIWAMFIGVGIIFSVGLPYMNYGSTGIVEYNTYCLFGCLAATGVAQCAAQRENKLRRFLIEINKGSYYIYLAHPIIILMGMLVIYPRLGVENTVLRMIINLAVIWITVLPLSILYVKLKGGIKAHGKIRNSIGV